VNSVSDLHTDISSTSSKRQYLQSHPRCAHWPWE